MLRTLPEAGKIARRFLGSGMVGHPVATLTERREYLEGYGGDAELVDHHEAQVDEAEKIGRCGWRPGSPTVL